MQLSISLRTFTAILSITLRSLRLKLLQEFSAVRRKPLLIQMSLSLRSQTAEK